MGGFLRESALLLCVFPEVEAVQFLPQHKKSADGIPVCAFLNLLDWSNILIFQSVTEPFQGNKAAVSATMASHG